MNTTEAKKYECICGAALAWNRRSQRLFCPECDTKPAKKPKC